MKTIGIILVIAGIFALFYTGYTYYTEEKVVNIGSVEITKEKPHSISWPPIAGIILIVGGVVVILTDKKSSNFS